MFAVTHRIILKIIDIDLMAKVVKGEVLNWPIDSDHRIIFLFLAFVFLRI